MIKKLLPAKAVARLKFLNAKNVKEYIDEDNIPVLWNGKNAYEYSWTPEKVTAVNGGKVINGGSGNALIQGNNGDIVNSNKKVSSICWFAWHSTPICHPTTTRKPIFTQGFIETFCEIKF